MKRPSTIKINQFQLARLLNKDQKQFFDRVTKEDVYCGKCIDAAPVGMTINEIFLNDLNDIVAKGTCNNCNHEVARMIEFGEDKAFYEKAMNFRKSLED
jgi:hypothetical protein